MNEVTLNEICAFSLPSYQEIPGIGLFLEQTMKYINEYLGAVPDMNLTGSMISNYVKKGIIKNPVKKQYGREQIAYLFFIAMAKSVLPLEDIQLLFGLQEETYTCEQAYEYFRSVMKEELLRVFGLEAQTAGADKAGTGSAEKNPEEKALVRNTIITIAHRIYLEKYFHEVRKGLNR